MNLKKDLELVSVKYTDNDQKAILTFLDREAEEVRDVNFNRQVYDGGKYIADKAKAEKVDKWCADYFGCKFAELPTQVGTKHDIYCYDTFNSVFECDIVSKPNEDMAGHVYNVKISAVQLDKHGVHLRFEINGNTYEAKTIWSDYMEEGHIWYVNPDKKKKQSANFARKYGVIPEDADQLIGHEGMVEIRSSFGVLWCDLKPFEIEKKKK